MTLALVACRAEAPPQEQQQQQPAAAAPAPDRDGDERLNLLNIAHGASVVSRTGEFTLEQSAICAIDGDKDSWWTSPPNDPQQTLVFSLPAPTRIEKLDLRDRPGPRFSIKDATVEVSSDGAAFAPFKAPADAQYIRVNVGPASGPFASITSVYVRGQYTAAPTAPDIAGCWTINGQPASFATSGARTTGTVGDISLDGGRDGAIYRFVWTRGPEWGHALITMSPDGKHLCGIKWHQEPIAYDYGDSWFGDRCATAKAPQVDTLRRFFEAAHRYPVYGDPITTIAAFPGRIRLVSREFTAATPEENRTRAKQRLDALRATLQQHGVDINRIQFVVAGSDNPHQPIENESMRVLYGVIEIEQ